MVATRSLAILVASAAISVGAVPIIPRACTEPRLDNDKMFNSANEPANVNITSSDECKAYCLSRAECTGYQWYTTGAGQWWKASMCTVQEAQQIKTYQYGTGPVQFARCRSLDQEEVDYPGLDIGNAPAANVIDCALQCDDRADCFAYTWASSNNGTCYMKSGRPSVIGGPFDGTLLSGVARKCREPRKDYDLIGAYPFKTVKNRPHWKDCERDCMAERCEGFSWSNFEGGTCWLKHPDLLSHSFTFEKKIGVVATVCM